MVRNSLSYCNDGSASAHSYGYSLIALQELNMYYHYGSIYWNAGVLSTQALSDEEGSGGGINYPNVTKAIYNIKKHGCDIEPPKINFADNDFEINPEDNKIYFALSAIPLIGKDDVEIIKKYRPYKNLKDFVDKTKLQPSKIVNLIKAGCFGEPLKQMVRYSMITTEIPSKIGITQAKKYPDLLSEDLKEVLLTIGDIKKKENNLGKIGSKTVYRLEEKYSYLVDDLKYEKFWWEDGKGICITDKGIDKAFVKQIDEIKNIVSTERYKEAYKNKLCLEKFKKLTKENTNIKEWEFEATSYYHNGNILNDIDIDYYGFVRFDDMPINPKYKMKSFGKRSWREYDLYAMPVTVIGRNDNHHTVFGLTADDKIVTIKMSDGEFAHYKKKSISGNWLERGKKIIVHGYRKGDSFVAKKYKSSCYSHTIYGIDSINEDGSIAVTTEKE